MLFQLGNFILHSGYSSPFKIECDALDDGDYAALAEIVANKFRFSTVVGVPTGGIKFAKALSYHAIRTPSYPALIVDDVLTTGGSMGEAGLKYTSLYPRSSIIGVVIFARGKCPEWITPIFQMWS